MANIPISSLPEVTTANDNDYLAVDNGTTSSKIKIRKFNESATASAQAYAAAAAASADAAEGYKDAAQTAKSETQNLITSAQTIVSNAQTYAGNAQTSENNASTYASNASNSASAAANSATQASQYAQGVNSYATEAKSWAQGGTGTRSGEDTDNAKYYSNLAHSYEQDASSAASAAAGSASNASDYKDAASGSATSAGANALVAEGYATGKQNGEAVSSGTYYHNNAEYFADQASGSATAASNQADRAEAAVVHEPYIGENGNWYVWSWEDNDYVDTEVDATGPAGADGQDGQDGQDGDPGPAGNGIVSITKTSTSGLVDTYTILYTNGDTDTFTVTNGQDGTGSGDMTKADYDSTEAVHNAGGIVAYVAAQLSGFSTQLSGLSDVDLTSLSTGQTLTYNGITQKWVNTSLGTAASCNVPASGNASTSEVVKGDDTRLTDARTPVSHTHTKSEISDFPTLGTAAAKDSTNAVTQNSTDLVESGAVYTEVNAKQNKTLSSAIGGQTTVEGALSSQNTAIANEAETRAKLGAHNRLPLDLATIKSLNTSGTWSGNAYTVNNVTFTVNDDFSITANTSGAASATAFLALASNIVFKAEDYILSAGSSIDGQYSKYGLYLQRTGQADITTADETKKHFVLSTDTVFTNCKIFVANGESVTNLVFKPMVTLATDPYTEYTPYVPTNAELLSADTNAVLGAHNWVPTTLSRIKALNTTGTWNNNVYSINSLTITFNDDLSVSVSGTASANTEIQLSDMFSLPAGVDFVMEGTPASGGADKYWWYLKNRTSSDTQVKNINPTESGNVLHFTADATNHYYRAYLYIWASQATSVTFKPMIRLASDPSTAYAPYAMTNRELTELATVVSDTSTLFKYHKVNSIVTMQLVGQQTYADIKNLTIPAGFRPNSVVTALGYCVSSSSRYLGVFNLNSNGSMAIGKVVNNAFTTPSDTDNFEFSTCYYAGN